MAQDGNAILKQILGVVIQIRDQEKKDSKSDTGASPLSGLFGKKGVSKEAKDGANVIKSIFESITEFNKVKINTRRIDATSKALKGLFNTIIFIGRKYRTIGRAIHLFDTLARSLKSMTRFAKAMTNLLLSIGFSIVAIAGGIALAGVLLGTRGRPLATMGILVAVLTGLTLTMVLLGKFERQIDRGSRTAKGMGVGLMLLSGGLFLFTLTIVSIGKIFGATGAKGIVVGLLGAIGMIAVMGLVFAGLGQLAGSIFVGSIAAAAMGIGLASLSWGLSKLAATAAEITNLGDGGTARNKKGETRGKFGQLMSEIGPGLGAIAIMTVSAGLLFSGLGLLAGPIILGVITAIGMSLGLILFAKATQKMMTIATKLDTSDGPKGIKTVIGGMVGGVLGGLIDGVGGALSGGEKGLKGFAKGIKNIAILTAGIGLLMGVSVMLSMFAKAMTAFVNLGNMRVIKSYNEKTGEPVFGENVDIRGVGETVTLTIGQFLKGLITATDGLTRREAGAIKKMGRALTGRRGILRAVIDFTDVLKTYAEFGPKGKIGYVDMIPAGTDEDGNAMFKQEPKTVLITEIVTSIIDSFGEFVSQLASRADEFGVNRREGNSMKRLASALTGRRGMLGPIVEFTKVIDAYARYGSEGNIIQYKTDSNGELILDANGEPDILKILSIEDIAVTVADVLSKFSTKLATELERTDRGSANKAADKMKSFDKMVTQLGKLAESTAGLDMASVSLMKMATSIGALADNINKLDADKVDLFGEIVKLDKNVGGGIFGRNRNQNESANVAAEEESKTTISTTVAPTTTASPIINTQELAIAIGDRVAAAFKSGQFRFEFATDKSGVMSFD